jgi:hypothetical protein
MISPGIVRGIRIHLEAKPESLDYVCDERGTQMWIDPQTSKCSPFSPLSPECWFREKEKGEGLAASLAVLGQAPESVVQEFPSERHYINLVPGILNLLPFPIYVGNRECPEGNQIDAGHQFGD